jgi:hypothetical protein
MSRRRLLILPLVALLSALALVVGACGDDDASDEKKPTTTAEKDDASSEDDSDMTTSTMSPEEFDAAIAATRATLDAAGDDPCKVMEAFATMGQSIGAPTTTEQRKQTTEVALAFYRALADAAPESMSAEAETIRTTVDEIAAEGEEKDYSEEFLTEPDAIKNDTGFSEATGKIMTSIGAGCAPEAGADGAG